MGNIGDPIVSGSIPAVGTSGTTYASQLNLFLTEVKNRLEAHVPKTSLLDGVLDMNGYGVSNASYLGLEDVGTTPSSPLNSFQMYNGEVYWISAAGVVQLTDTGHLNAAGIGGITGDYGSPNPAQFRFVDADQEYYAYDDYGAGTWAYLGALGLDLFKNTTSTTHVRVKGASTMSASYTMTMPPAAPGANALLRMDSSGNVTTTAQVEYEFSPDVTTWIPYSGSGFISTYAGSTGDGTWQLTGVAAETSPVYFTCLSATNASATKILVPINLPVGAVITQVVVYWRKSSNASSSLTIKLNKRAQSTGVITTVCSGAESGNAIGDTSKVLSTGLPHTITSSYSYHVTLGITTDPNVTGDRFYGLDIVYTL